MERFQELKPLEPIDVRAIKEMKNFKVKIVDMGNACNVHKKISSIIQTRNYRGPEIMVRAKYDQSADIWSLGCTVWELITGKLLFKPKKTKEHGKNQHHLSMIYELIGTCPNQDFLRKGKRFDVSNI